MGYPARQYHEGHWYHVYARGLSEVCLFESEEERTWFVEKLDTIFDRRHVSLGALCLMDTHYHALVRMGPVLLDRALNGLHMSYTKHVNAVRGREGPLFRDRPGCDIVLDDSYLLQLVPYIHNNPVEAGMVSSVSEYEWNTDGMYRNKGESLIDWSCWQYPPYFQGEDHEQVYRQRLGEPWEDLDSEEGYIGTKEEWEQLERRKPERCGHRVERRGRPSMREITSNVVESDDVDVEDLQKKGQGQPETRRRREAMVSMYEEGYGPKEIGDFFGRDKSTVNHAVRDLRSQ